MNKNNNKNELLEKTKLDVQNEKLKMLDNLNKEIEEQIQKTIEEIHGNVF